MNITSSLQNQVPLLALYNAYKVQQAQKAGLVPVTVGEDKSPPVGMAFGTLGGIGLIVAGSVATGVYAGRKLMPSNKGWGAVLGLLVGFPLLTTMWGMKKFPKTKGAGAAIGFFGGSAVASVAVPVVLVSSGLAGAVV